MEDRSRRNNLIFRGITDAKESWQQTESKLFSAIAEVVDSFSADSIERAHRLGVFSGNRCRPIIANLSGFKARAQIFSLRGQFKSRNITISEDFLPGTRSARKKLLEIGNNQPGKPSFKLCHNKIFLNDKCSAHVIC